MSDSRPHRERVERSKLGTSDLKEWLEDYVVANRSASFEDCITALVAEGFTVPLSGTRELWRSWIEIWQDVYGRGVRASR